MAGIALAALPPVSEEQAFLETYFLSLSKFAYDRAKEITEKQKEQSRTHPSILWVSCLSQLLNLALVEKGYASLTFLSYQNLGQRIMGRRYNLKTTYKQMRGEFVKMEESTAKWRASEAQLEKLLCHLSGQLSNYVSARLKMMEFYEQIVGIAQSRPVIFGDQLVIINDIIDTNQKNFHHPILSPIKTCFSLETDIMRHLLSAQVSLQNVQFLPTLIQLNEASNKLTSWSNQAVSRDVPKKLPFTSTKTVQPHTLCQWLAKFKGLLVSKFSLYFYETLSKQAPTQEVRSFTAKATVDFLAKIITFQKRTDASCVCLVLEVPSMSEEYHGTGYQHPKKYKEELSGIDGSYPAIFTYPGEKPDKIWPNVVMFLTRRPQEVSVPSRIIYFWDELMQQSYFSVRVEPSISLVILFETHKAEKDSYIVSTLMEISSQLQCTKLFASLKQGTK